MVGQEGRACTLRLPALLLTAMDRGELITPGKVPEAVMSPAAKPKQL
jgi:hypothetical protein